MPTNLSEKIKFINRQNALARGAALPPEDEEAEAASEERMLKSVEEIWADTQEQEEKTEQSQLVDQATPTCTFDDLWLELHKVHEIVEAQQKTLDKINKHINATQKMLKKGGK